MAPQGSPISARTWSTDPKLNSVLNGDWSNSVPLKQIWEGPYLSLIYLRKGDIMPTCQCAEYVKYVKIFSDWLWLIFIPTEDLGDQFLVILCLLKILAARSCWFYAYWWSRWPILAFLLILCLLKILASQWHLRRPLWNLTSRKRVRPTPVSILDRVSVRSLSRQKLCSCFVIIFKMYRSWITHIPCHWSTDLRYVTCKPSAHSKNQDIGLKTKSWQHCRYIIWTTVLQALGF